MVPGGYRGEQYFIESSRSKLIYQAKEFIWRGDPGADVNEEYWYDENDDSVNDGSRISKLRKMIYSARRPFPPMPSWDETP